jgi:serpin B
MTATAINTFGLALWRTLPAGNFAMSPASIAITLSMVWTGARRETEQQMREVLRLDRDVDQVTGALGALVEQLAAVQPGVTLRIANRLFGQRGYDFEPPFTTRLAAAFAAPLEQLDFAGDADAARAEINAWVEAQTENEIEDLLPARSLDATTRLVLVNAIYFLGKWAFPFLSHDTDSRPFWIDASTTSNVPMMHRTGTYRIAQVDGGDVIELPYRGGTTAMYVVRPRERDGLAAVEQRLSDPTRWLAHLGEETVKLALPRFVVDPETAKLNDALAKLGMPLAFDSERADFTGMVNPGDATQELYLAAVFHKACVKTDEEGTVAAAATAAVMATRGLGPPIRPFVIDRPFLFFILDRASGLVLFMGRVADPR